MDAQTRTRSRNALLSLGSNLGDREWYLRRAREMIANGGLEILKLSQELDNDPLLLTDQPRFLNQLLEVRTPLSPEELLSFLKQCEQSLGRMKRMRYGPREIDLDILAYQGEHRQTNSLTLPHPGVLERDYLHILLSEMGFEATGGLLDY